MSLAHANRRISPDEFLEGELMSEILHEYVAGNVYAISGGTLNHQRIAGNFFIFYAANSPVKPVFLQVAISSSASLSEEATRHSIIRTA